MAQQLITLTHCDECLDRDGSQTDAHPVSIVVDLHDGRAPQSYSIDVCDVHGKPFVELVELLTAYGRREPSKGRRAPVAAAAQQLAATGTTSSSAPMRSCPVSGCGYVGIALDSHAKSAHDSTVGELNGTATLPCPEPGCTRMFTAPQGVTRHRMSAHGFQPGADG